MKRIFKKSSYHISNLLQEHPYSHFFCFLFPTRVSSAPSTPQHLKAKPNQLQPNSFTFQLPTFSLIMGHSYCRCCGKCHACNKKKQQQKPREIYGPGDDPSMSSGSRSLTTSYSSESDNISGLDSAVEVLPVKPSMFRDVYHPGLIFKHFLIERATDSDVLVKWQRCRHTCEHNHVHSSMQTAEKANDILLAFKRCVSTCGWNLMIVKPTIARTPPVHGHPHGRYVTIEKFVPGLVKANSNSGFVRSADSIPWKLVQALPHFSYAWSKGALVMCNFHVQFDYKQKLITIVSPTILTHEGGVYGCTDLGMKGMCNFFHWHRCNRFCTRYEQPKRTDRFYNPVPNTMVSSHG